MIPLSQIEFVAPGDMDAASLPYQTPVPDFAMELGQATGANPTPSVRGIRAATGRW